MISELDLLGRSYLFNEEPASDFISIFVFTIVGAFFNLGFRYLEDSNKQLELKNLKREIELSQLKNQLNPHFLFNALNNIHRYNLENNSIGNDLIFKLSDLMRFVLNSIRKERILLIEEVKFIENYISFEKERLKDRCTILYETDIESVHLQITPFIIFPLIENAFKHGTNSINQCQIKIVIRERKGTLTAIIENGLTQVKTESTETGLYNLNKRLSLCYPGKFSLSSSILNNRFICDLKVNL